MKHILCLTTSYPLWNHDISGHFVQRLNEIYLKAGYRVTVICFDRGGRPHHETVNKNNLDSVVTIIKVKVVRGSMRGGAPDQISAYPWKSALTMPINMARLAIAFQKEVKRCLAVGEVPYVMAHWSIPCGLIARSLSPVIYCHGGDIATLERLPFGQTIARHIVSKARVVICVSQDLKDRLEKLSYPHRKIKIIPMGIDEPKVSHDYKRELQEMTKGHFIIVTIGRLEAIKGYDLLLEALGQLQTAERSKVKWLMAGDGTAKEALLNRAQSLYVNVHALGFIKPSQRDTLLSIADVFVSPSRQIGHRVEGAPLSLREAVLSGCPIIATELGGVKAILDRLPQRLIHRVKPEVTSILSAITYRLHQQEKSSEIDQVLDERSRQEMSRMAKQLWTWKALESFHMTLIDHYIQA
jgi:glycosyltransferase involved in cell wall biosynthesis